MTKTYFSDLIYSKRVIRPSKAKIGGTFGSRTVLTNEPWTFVSLWLRRAGLADARKYWEQAQHFFKASRDLPAEAAPLCLYYSYLNAAKALLSSKKMKFDEWHGVTDGTPRDARAVQLTSIQIAFKERGVVPALAGYLRESDEGDKYSLQELLFNLPFVHRTYCLTNRSQQDMFQPLRNCRYVFDAKRREIFFCAETGNNIPVSQILSRLPRDIVACPELGDRAVRSRASLSMVGRKQVTPALLRKLEELHSGLRHDIYYINGAQTLWYLKLMTKGPRRIERQTLTLTLAGMHRLSEMCRYRPIQFERLLAGRNNWLVTEFIQMSPYQYFDEIAAELTGHDVLIPNVRPAS